MIANRFRHSENARSAFALIMVLLVIAAASVLGMCSLWASSVRLDGSHNFILAGRARMLAESGIQHGLYLFQAQCLTLEAARSNNPLGPFSIDSTDDTYKFYLAGPPSNSIYTLVAEGACGGLVARSSVAVRLKSSYKDLLLSMGPSHYWRLGETSGTRCNDLVGGVHGWYMNGVSLGCAGVVVGDTDTCAGFNGSNNFVDFAPINAPDEKMTMLAWVYPDEVDLYNKWVLSKVAAAAPNRYYWALGVLGSSQSNKLACRMKTGNQTTTLQSSVDIPKGRWVFLAAVYDGQRLVLYQDGVEVGRVAQSGTILQSSNNAVIGGIAHQPTQNPWSGMIDEVAILFKALNADQIHRLNNAIQSDVEIVKWLE